VSDLLIADVEVEGQALDVLVRAGRIVAMGRGVGDARVQFDGAGGALLPGLHDHHIHLMATAAARMSVDLADTDVPVIDAIRAADRDRPRGSWLRVVGYHESMAGPLDRDALDSVVRDRPVRVQHRTGAMWILNSAALDAVAGALDSAPAGLERDADGRPTGRCLRIDAWLREHVPSIDPDLDALAHELRGFGITGVTDMTPYDTLEDARPLLHDSLPLSIVLTGSPELTDAPFPPTITVGPVKILLEDHDPPAFGDLVDWIRAAHAAGRNVAVHCVTRAALALIVAAWDEAGASPGDRVEHGAVVPPQLSSPLAAHGITVVTQPAFVGRRGDQYLSDVDAEDVPHLWPCRSLLDHGIDVAGSSDAPYGPTDPWEAIATATTRRTRSGALLGADETISARRALDLYLGHPKRPGGPPRRVAVGAPADLCLLDRPLVDALAAPSAQHVRRTWIAGAG
jgi:predicted amidohydrolase YtcJ